MGTSHFVGVPLAASLLLAACGGAPPPPPTTGASDPKPEVADSQNLTEFQKTRLLGHYSTEEGKHGFVLDRTAKPPRARLDGEQGYEELSEQGSVSGAVEYKSPSGKIWLRLDKESGDVLLFQGPGLTEGTRVIRDADAQQLK
jgi:hypothetical protein